MHWNEQQNHLMEQLKILIKLRERFGKDAIKIASNAKLEVHKKWIKKYSYKKPIRPSEIFMYSAFSVTSAEENLLKYRIIEDTEELFAVEITYCKYADFYIKNGEPEIGYAMHCFIDFGEAETFSSDVILSRTKTLMQGDKYCNHCYRIKKK